MPWCASAPHHVTAVFLPFYSTRLEASGSIGAGLAVGPRLTVCIPGHQDPPTGTAARALALLGSRDRGVRYSAPLPPGKGYAVSAASAIAAALASTRIDGRKTGYMEALVAAHKAEILERTGLGDVLAISCGVGLVLRTVPGGPGLGRVECVPLPRSIQVFSLEGEGTMHTGLLLSQDYISKHWRDAERRLRRIFEDRTLEVFAREAMEYTRGLRLDRAILGERASRLERTPGLIGYYAKKRVVIVIVESDRALDAGEHLRSLGAPGLRVLEPSEHGPEVWWDSGW